MPGITKSSQANASEEGLPAFLRLPLFLQNVLLSLGAALLSIGFQGFSYAVHNNYFHLPIVFSLWNDPNFKADAYVQSLHYYASAFWYLAGPLITESNAPFVFFAFHVASRWIFMGSMLACARLLDITELRSRLLFMVMITLSSMVTGYSVAGGHGMLIDYFAHSEVANGVALFALYFLVSGRIATAFAFNGLVFSINAFMAVWNAVPFALCIAWQLFRKEMPLSRLLRQSVIGIVAFLAISAPTIFWIVEAEKLASHAPAFDYVGYLRFYWPFHFLFGENPLDQQIVLLLLFLYALVGFLSLGRAKSAWVFIVLGYIAIYVAGIFVPDWTHSPSILNLHFLRVGGLIQILACLVMASLSASWLSSRDALDRGLFGPLTLLATCTSSYLEPLFLVALSVRTLLKKHSLNWLQQLWPDKLGKIFQILAIVLVCAALPRHILRNYSDDASEEKLMTRWEALATWARNDTPTGSVFLLPVSNMALEMKYQALYDDTNKWYLDSFPFEAFAHRPIWVNFKQGAAVMWMPSFYPQWDQRIREVLALKTDRERIDYARQHHINYVVVEATSPEASASGVKSVYKNDLLRVLEISDTPPMEKTPL